MKNKVWLLFLFIALSVFLLCFSLDFVAVYSKANFILLWFISVLVFIGIFLLVRAFQHKIDSNLFIAILMICIAIALLVYEIFALNFNFIWPFFILGLVLSHISTFLYFKDKLHLKLALVSIGLFLISILFGFGVINVTWFILAILFWLFALIFSYFMINSNGGAI